MRRFYSLTGAAALGWLGWVVGAQVGIMTALMLGSVGTALGMYLGTRIARYYGG